MQIAFFSRGFERDHQIWKKLSPWRIEGGPAQMMIQIRSSRRTMRSHLLRLCLFWEGWLVLFIDPILCITIRDTVKRRVDTFRAREREQLERAQQSCDLKTTISYALDGMPTFIFFFPPLESFWVEFAELSSWYIFMRKWYFSLSTKM